jgi:hypothetical protein
VHLFKTIKLVKQISNAAVKYSPYDPSVPLKPGESLVTEKVNYRTLGPGQSFPGIDSPDLFKHITDSNLKGKLVSRLTYSEPRGLNLSYCQATCKTAVGCIDIPKLDFAKLATEAMVKAAISESRLVCVPMSELKNQWMLQREWTEFKKRVSQETRDKVAARKWVEEQGLADFSAHWMSPLPPRSP